MRGIILVECLRCLMNDSGFVCFFVEMLVELKNNFYLCGVVYSMEVRSLSCYFCSNSI